jgi:citrate lyase subunit beta/citryl-CoA lyase
MRPGATTQQERSMAEREADEVVDRRERVLAFRSLLFSPGSSPEMMAKAKRSGADSLIFDLEDAVAPDRLPMARSAVAAALADGEGRPVFVRVNHPSTGQMEPDLDAVVAADPFGVILPKADGPAEVAHLDEALSAREEQAGLPQGTILVLPLVESCRGVRLCYEIATASPRVPGLAFSSGQDGDFMADLGGRWTPDGAAMLYPRSKLVCDTRAAGLRWPVDGVFMYLDDEDALAAECRLSRTLGFTAKMAIHPRQIPAIHAAFTPTTEEVADSRALIEAFRRAQDEGAGAFRYQGRMVDKANIRLAAAVLARAAGHDPAEGAG